MIRGLLKIFYWLERRKWILYFSLFLMVSAGIVLSTQLKLDENIYSFFGEDEAAFKNLKFKDKIVVEISGANPDSLILIADDFVGAVEPLQQSGLVGEITSVIDESQMFKLADFIYAHLPIFIDEKYYARIDTLISDSCIRESVANSLNMILSPGGMIMQDFITRDPLNIATPLLSGLENFNSDDYGIYAGHIFDKSYSSLYLFITPVYDMGNTGENDALVTALEDTATSLSQGGADITCFGGHIISVHNARQVKRDTVLTLCIALFIIVVVIFFAFNNKWSIPLIIVPPVFGALFALAIIVLVKGSVSAIAIGLGSIVLGVALSYSIHVIAHANHIKCPEQIITDLAYPLTVGCITTIGAFVALLFTRSQLLRDLGLFAALSLVGTTLFCLVYLPHFIKPSGNNKNKFLDFIERCNAYDYEDKKWIVAAVAITTFACLFFYNDVKFDADLNNINYVPENIRRAEAKMQSDFGKEANRIFLISSVDDENWNGYPTLISVCDSLLAGPDKLIDDFVSLKDFAIPYDVQKRRIQRWNEYWTEDKVNSTVRRINACARQCGFADDAFDAFSDVLSSEYDICMYDNDEMASVPVLSDWISKDDDNLFLVSSIELDDADKDTVYSVINDVPGVTVVDRSFFSSRMIEDISDDFNWILWVSSLLVFVTLFIIYGRLEVAVLTFLPMCISWVIILGLMAVFDIRFNIVNIILATLIFGIGDDFSIFIMDGLQQEYKNGKKILGMHKTAIFFSAFTTIVGIGVLVFAKHPAMKSIAMLSVLGIGVVVVVAYTIQPYLFRLLVVRPAEKGNFPVTIKSFFCSFLPFFLFLTGCVVCQLLILILYVVPLKKSVKQTIIHYFIYYVSKTVLFSAFHVKFSRRKYYKEQLSRQAIFVANHKSFIDVLLMMSLRPKIVLITSDWVWKSPLFAYILRNAGYFSAKHGYENLAEDLYPLVQQGYSVAVFPEGTRSYDEQILRFHKGAFYLSEVLKLDVVPLVIAGAGLILSKKQNLYLKPGRVIYELQPRIAFDDDNTGDTYQKKSKNVRHLIMNRYDALSKEIFSADNRYFQEELFYNYIYKGRNEEFEIRKQLSDNKYFIDLNKLVPMDGTVCEVGCGYGALSLMLSLLSKNRIVAAFDSDKEKIDIANHCFAKTGNLSYTCSENGTFDFIPSDCFIFNDCTCYSVEKLERLLYDCSRRLTDNGRIIIKIKPLNKSHNMKVTLQDLQLIAGKIGCKYSVFNSSLSYLILEK